MPTTYTLEDSELLRLRDKTILITGAASGIGRSAAEIAHQHGANVILGDWNQEDGDGLARQLKDRCVFRKCDVSNWDDVLDLFEAGSRAFGRIDAVLSNAGVSREADFTADKVDPETGRLLPPDVKVLNVNLLGAIFTTKAAIHYLGKEADGPKQIVITGSAASFLDTPPLHLYCASKTGILGFMRSLRSQILGRGISVNMVAPWLTKTAMPPANVIDSWGDLPVNESWGVARALLLPLVRPEMNGCSLFVAGNEITDLESGLREMQPGWMGEQLSRNVDRGQEKILKRSFFA